MATYVISDIHGCFDEFMKMLAAIRLQCTDELIIAGDIVDRGPKTYEMLQWMLQKPENVIYLPGNHDVGFAGYLEELRRHGVCMDYYHTIAQLQKRGIAVSQMLQWKKIFTQLQYYVKRNINGRDFYIAHAGVPSCAYAERMFGAWEVGQARGHKKQNLIDYYLWSREEVLQTGGEAQSTVIFGHTPTISMNNFTYHDGKVWEWLRQSDGCRFVGIDCGCVYGYYGHGNARLACLRLEDGKVWYVDSFGKNRQEIY